MNIFNEFHQRFLFELLKHEVDFIVVGGLSVVFHGYIRTTGDMDLWIRPTNENKLKLLPVISQFGLTPDSIEMLQNKDFTQMLAFHFNHPPDKIEFLTSVSGLEFDDAFVKRDHLAIENFEVPFLSFEDLIINKMTAGRLKDRADVDELQKFHRKK